MSTFLFTAVNRDGKSVTERVEAENLSQARYKLEMRSYSEIAFYESELSHETEKLFDEKHLKGKNKQLQNQVDFQYDTTLGRYFLNVFKSMWIFGLIILGAFLYTQNTVILLLLISIIFLLGYLSVPRIIINYLHQAHCWDKNKQVRFWSYLGKIFNPISYVKIPDFEIDGYISCVDAREGKIEAALERLMKYQNDPKISKRMFDLKLVRIYGNARDFDKVRSLFENFLTEGNIYTEELVDYAICLARRHKQTSQAREALERVFECEFTVLGNLFIPYCQGIIEVEDGNFSQAEFYLKRASKELEPFKKNTYLVGLKYEVKAFLAMALGKCGEKVEAERLFREAKPYLVAVKENELIRRCEEALN